MKYNIEIKQGADFKLRCVWRNPDKSPIDVTGCVAALQVRSDYSNSVKLVDINTIDSADGRITMGGVAGTIDIWIKKTKTTSLVPANAVYDLEFTDTGGAVTRLLEGKAIITPEVTK